MSLLGFFQHPLLKDCGGWSNSSPRHYGRHRVHLSQWSCYSLWSSSGHVPAWRLGKCISDQAMVHPRRDIDGAFLQFMGAERGVPRWKLWQGNWEVGGSTQPCSAWSRHVNTWGRGCCSNLSFGQGGRNRWDWCWFSSKTISFWTSAVKSRKDKTATTTCCYTKSHWVVPRKSWKIPPC